MVSERLAHFSIPEARVQAALARLQQSGALHGGIELRAIGKGAVTSATGSARDVMTLIGRLAEEGEDGLLSVEGL